MSIKIKGLSKLTADLKKFGVEGTNVVKKQLDFAATNIQRAAFTAAPPRIGKQDLNIKQRIIAKPLNGGLTYQIGIFGSEDMDGYIEFGTGVDFIDIVNERPKEYTPQIRQLAYDLFYKNGQGTLRGTPYLFPAFFDESPKLIENLKSELTKLANKV